MQTVDSLRVKWWWGWKHATDTKNALVNINIHHLSYNKHYISGYMSCLDLNDMLSGEEGETSFKMVAASVFSYAAYFSPLLQTSVCHVVSET